MNYLYNWTSETGHSLGLQRLHPDPTSCTGLRHGAPSHRPPPSHSDSISLREHTQIRPTFHLETRITETKWEVKGTGSCAFFGEVTFFSTYSKAWSPGP